MVGGSSPAWSECRLIFTPLLRFSYVKFLPVPGFRPTTLATVYFSFFPVWLDQLLWRNWLARSAVNRKVGGSSPPRSECFFNFHAFVTFLLREGSSCSRFQAYNPGHRVI